MTVSRGPPSEVVDANKEFTRTFQKPNLRANEVQDELDQPEPAFVVLGITDLVPQGQLSGYQRALNLA